MKNNLDFRRLFDSVMPDEGEIDRIEKEILERERQRKAPRLRLIPAAAVMIMLLGLTAAAAAAPAAIRYFFPGLGVVERTQDEDAEPLYMMLDTEDDSARFDLMYGYWYDGTAEVYFRSLIRYDTRDTIGEIMHVAGSGTPDGEIQTYRLTITGVSHEEAAEGIKFEGGLLKFDRMPAEYRPYTVEDTGLRLTMIPLTEDYTVFAMSLEYLDGRDGLELLAKGNIYDTLPTNSMYLVDESGNLYPMIRYYDSEIFCIEAVPVSPISGFRSDELSFRRAFYDDGLSTAVALSIPSEGEAESVSLTFTFPDGVTIGRIYAVGYNNAVRMEPDIYSKYYPMGSLTVITDVVEQEGIRYRYTLGYSESYSEYLNEFLVIEERSPYDSSDLDPMAPRTHIGLTAEGDKVSRTQHYISDGNDTVMLSADHYYAEAPGSWDIDF